MASNRKESSKRDSPLARIRGVIEFVLLLVAIPTALVTFFALLPQAWDFTHQRSVQFSMLSALHAGYSLDKFKSTLGEPTLVTANGALDQYTFLGDEFAVTASVDGRGSVVAYGVLACNPGFKPTFHTPGQTTVTLNSAPLSTAEVAVVGIARSEDAMEAARFYVPNASPGSDNLVIEPGVNSEAGSTGPPYVFGVSDACGGDTHYASMSSLDEGRPTEAARKSIEAFRSRVAPNFYSEAVFGELRTAEYGACFHQYESEDCARPVVGRLDLPPEFRSHPDKAWWRNLWPTP